jgi:hypothetical protein
MDRRSAEESRKPCRQSRVSSSAVLGLGFAEILVTRHSYAVSIEFSTFLSYTFATPEARTRASLIDMAISNGQYLKKKVANRVTGAT